MELNIYCLGLIEESEDTRTQLENYIKSIDDDKVESNGLKKVSEECYKQYFVKKSMWSKYREIESMLNSYVTESSENEEEFRIETPSAVVFVNVEMIWYCLTFGHGRFYLETDKVKKGWGTSIVLNLYKKGYGLPSTVKSHQLDIFKKHEKTDIQSGASLDAYGIESYRAIIDGINLKLTSEEFEFSGQITGLDNVQLKSKSNELTKIISELEANYDEKLNINMFNNIECIYDEDTITEHDLYMNTKCLEFIEELEVNIPSKFLHKEWYSPNNLIIRKKRKKTNECENAKFDDIRQQIRVLLAGSLDSTNPEINIGISEQLEGWVVRAFDQNDVAKFEDIPLYNCISYTYMYANNEYVLDEGEIYKFKNNLIQQVQEEINRLTEKDYDIDLPNIHDGWVEDDYNRHISTLSNNNFLLDKQNVQLTGASKFELADVIIKNGDEYHLIHNKGTFKNSAGSSCISHLARQVEGSLHFLVNNPEEKIRQNIINILERVGIDYEDFRDKVKNRKIKLVAGIVNTHNDVTKLPDFSKVTIAELNRKVAANGFDFIPISINRETTQECSGPTNI